MVSRTLQALIIGLLAMCVLAPAADARRLPIDPDHTDDYFDSDTEVGAEPSCLATFFEFAVIDGVRREVTPDLYDEIRNRFGTPNCPCGAGDVTNHVLRVSCQASSDAPPLDPRNRYGDELSSLLEALGVLVLSNPAPRQPGHAPDDYEVPHNQWSAPQVAAIIVVLSSIIDGGFRDDNRAAAETLEQIGANLEQRIGDLQRRRSELDAAFARQDARARQLYDNRLRALPDNLQAAQRQQGFHAAQLSTTRLDIDQRIDAALGSDLDPASLKAALAELLDRAGPPPPDIVLPQLQTRLFADEIRAIYPPAPPRRHALRRERHKQDQAFADARNRVRDNLRAGRADPVFESEAELDLVELYGRSRVATATAIEDGSHPKAAGLGGAERDRLIDGLLDDARSARYFAGGLLTGITRSVVETVDSFIALPDTAVEIYENADAIGTALADAVINYERTGAQISAAVKREWLRFEAGDARVKGEIVGEILGVVGQELIGGAGVIGATKRLKQFGRLGKLATAQQRLDGVIGKTTVIVRETLRATDTLVSDNPVVSRQLARYTGVRRSLYLTNNLDDAQAARLATQMGARTDELNVAIDSMRAAGTPLSEAATDYVAHANLVHSVDGALNRSRGLGGAGTYARIGRRFDRLDGAISNVQPLDLDAKVIRAVELQTPGGHINTPATVFLRHEGLINSNHRFSRPGEAAVYAAMADDAAVARATIRAELRAKADASLVWGELRVRGNMLDLTDPTVRRHLAVELKDIKFDVRSAWDVMDDHSRTALLDRGYETTQILGHLARRHGFDGIISPSAVFPDGRNVVLFAPGM